MKAPALAAILLSLAASDLLACRYTVRDIGFVDLGPPPYRLRIHTEAGTAGPIEAAARMHAALSDTNIAVEVVLADRKEDLKVPFLPAAVLQSADGSRLLLPPFEAGEAKRIIGEAVLSPARERILGGIVDSFCVILLIRGDDPARGVISKSIDRVTPLLHAMDKPHDRPPVVVEIPEDSLSEERVLLWSLGVDPESGNSPLAVLLYGKGRRMGPVLAGPSLTEDAIIRLFRLIGTDCECGLDLERFEHPAPFQAGAIGPDRVVVHHQQHAGQIARPVCEPGQFISQGELLADLAPTALGVPVHASVAGKVVEVTPKATVIERSL